MIGRSLSSFSAGKVKVDAVDADLLAEAQAVDLVGHAEDADRQRGGIAAGFARHRAELLDDHADAVLLQPVGAGNPAVAVADRAPRGIGEGAADDDRRMRLLRGLGPLLHLVEVHELAVILGLFLGPDGLHRLDPFARQFMPAGEHSAMVLDLVLVPAVADAEQEAAVRQLVDRRDDLGGDDGIALRQQGDAGADLELGRHRGRGVERQERIHDVVIGPDQAARPPGRASCGWMGCGCAPAPTAIRSRVPPAHAPARQAAWSPW